MSASVADALCAENAVERDLAVIDIGSNTVRLVHFRLEGRALWPIFNEKVTAGLGRAVGETGKLHPGGVETAMRALKRYAGLLDAKHVSERYAVATAAVRNADDGPAFCAQIKAETGFDVRVLSGAEEAMISALGVSAGIPHATGLAGDLGGSSLELTPLDDGVVGIGESHALGPLSVPQAVMADPAALPAHVDAILKTAEALKAKGQTFYAVGGAWRALAQLAMVANDHPLRVSHQFELSQAEATKVANLAARSSIASLSGIDGIASRRAAQLPYAGLLLKRIMAMGGFKRVVFSSYGVREGVVFEQMSQALRDVDPLISGAEALARNAAPSPSFGRAVANWIEPVFAASGEVFGARGPWLRATASRLADLGSRLHPDHKADLASDLVMYAPFAGLTHPERAFLALAIYHRYAGKSAPESSRVVERLLNDEQRKRAMAIGLALRLGAAVSGRSEPLLAKFTLARRDETLVLEMPEAESELMVERAQMRFESLANALGLTPQTVIV